MGQGEARLVGGDHVLVVRHVGPFCFIDAGRTLQEQREREREVDGEGQDEAEDFENKRDGGRQQILLPVGQIFFFLGGGNARIWPSGFPVWLYP